MFKTFSIGLALLAGLFGPTQAGHVPISTQATALSAPEEPGLDAIGPPPLAPCALGCNQMPLSLIVPPQGEARVPEPAGLALVAVAALAGLLVCRLHRRRAALAAPVATTALLDADTSAPTSGPSSVLSSTLDTTNLLPEPTDAPQR